MTISNIRGIGTTVTAFILAFGLSACTSSESNDDGERDSSETGGSGAGGSTSNTGYPGTTVAKRVPNCKIGGSVIEATTLAPNPACPEGFEVESDIYVQGTDGVLTIAPGTVLKFDADTGIVVAGAGTIKAIGTKDAPILFTGWQAAPGSWDGIQVTSGSMKNEISNAVVEYAGASTSENWGAISMGDGEKMSSLSLSSVELRKNGYFGLSLALEAKLTKFENILVSDNVMGAMRARAGSVHMFKGVGNRFENNGGNNSIRIAPSAVDADVTWPNLAPCVYRVVDESGTSGSITVENHLTIEPGTIIEFSPGLGLNMEDRNSGLSAIGTAEAPIVLRGIDQSGWLGVGFVNSSWTGNAFENVHFENAYGTPSSFEQTTARYDNPGEVSVAVGQLIGVASYLRVKNVSFSGPNAATNDFSVTSPAKLVVEGTNTGASATGGLAIEELTR